MSFSFFYVGLNRFGPVQINPNHTQPSLNYVKMTYTQIDSVIQYLHLSDTSVIQDLLHRHITRDTVTTPHNAICPVALAIPPSLTLAHPHEGQRGGERPGRNHQHVLDTRHHLEAI